MSFVQGSDGVWMVEAVFQSCCFGWCRVWCHPWLPRPYKEMFRRYLKELSRSTITKKKKSSVYLENCKRHRAFVLPCRRSGAQSNSAPSRCECHLLPRLCWKLQMTGCDRSLTRVKVKWLWTMKQKGTMGIFFRGSMKDWASLFARIYIFLKSFFPPRSFVVQNASSLMCTAYTNNMTAKR